MKRLLSPRSIAVVGGGTWCANVIEACDKIGFDGPVWPVHPTRAEFGGHAAFASIEHLPEAPDATFIGVNREATVEIVADLRARRAGGAVCFASGFAEAEAELAGGTDLQHALLQAAGEMPILGPNCYGLLNLLDRTSLWPDQHGAVPVDCGVAVIAQSSNVAINLTMQKRGLPIAFVGTVGNQAQIDIAKMGAALLEDPRITALGLYLEGIRDLRSFEQMAAVARQHGKSIIALKVGASEQAQVAAVSHTASLTGSATGASALFKRLGIGEVRSLGGFLEALKLLHVAGPLSSNRIASMSCSGGEASLAADSALGSGLVFPSLDSDQINALAQALGPKVALANPLDYHTYIWANRDAMADCFAAMMEGDLAIGLIILDFPREDRCDAAAWHIVTEAIALAMSRTGKTIALVASLPDTMPEAVVTDAMARGIPAFSGLTDTLEGLSACAALGARVANLDPLLLPTSHGCSRTLTEADAKEELATFGVNAPSHRKARSVQAAVEAAADLGFPVVLKAEGLAHKSDAGGVRIGLASIDAVAQAAEEMNASSFLVERMVLDGMVELLLGVTSDPAHGYVLTLGAGGVLTEILQDTCSLLLPVTENDIAQALETLRITPILAGYRGAPAAFTKGIVATALAVQDYVTAQSDRVLEVEINPLIVTETQAVVADALIRLKEIS